MQKDKEQGFEAKRGWIRSGDTEENLYIGCGAKIDGVCSIPQNIQGQIGQGSE